MSAASTVSRARVGSADLPQTALSLLLGTGFTLGLFLGIARFLKTEPDVMPPSIDELHAVSIPMQPPPPPRVQETEAVAEPAVLVFAGFEAGRSESPVKIAVSPPTFEAVLSTRTIRPQANIRVSPLEGTFKPRMDLTLDRQHVFQASEVDQRPAILYREDPKVPSYVQGDASQLRTVVIFVVNADGQIGDVRISESSGNPKFDAIVSSNIKKNWQFSAAVKKGKPVRCLLQQAVTVRWRAGSPFSTN